MLTRLTNKNGLNIAKLYKPRIVQQIRCLAYDIPCEIFLTQYEAPIKPVVYWAVRRDPKYWYCLYALFHAHDYTECIAAKILGIGEHKYDYEGFVVRIPVDGGERDIITIKHSTTEHWASPCPIVLVEWGSHAIKRYKPVNGTVLTIDNDCDMI